jgi:hypothetical protein
MALINYMDQSPYWEAESHSPGQEIPHLSWNSNVHHNVHNRQSLAPILSQIKLLHTLVTIQKVTLNINILLPSQMVVYSGYKINYFMRFSSPKACRMPPYRIFVSLVIKITLSVECK